MTSPPAPLRDVAIIGGGCYGSFRILVVDRDADCLASKTQGREVIVSDWDPFLQHFLDAPPPPAGAPDDAVVPSPLMPHLMAAWLRSAAERRWPDRIVSLVTPEEPLGTPYDTVGPDGTRYVSFADWICPTHCIEPLVCPMIRAPRTWEMGEALGEYTDRLAVRRPTTGPALFTTRHHAYGVGMFGAREIRASRATVLSAGTDHETVDVVVGTISACHGAVSILRIGPSRRQAADLY